jgi:hypothetical protein
MAVRSGEDVCYDRQWFGDDAAVDFPSADGAIERIRAGLLAGERTPALRASLEVARDDAAWGVSLPLDVPLRYNCRQCGGRGESWGEVCESCEGTGTQLSVERFRVRVPAGVRDGSLFRFSLTPRHHPTTRVELQVRLVSSVRP